jgi:hypothetical protein
MKLDLLSESEDDYNPLDNWEDTFGEEVDEYVDLDNFINREGLWNKQYKDGYLLNLDNPFFAPRNAEFCCFVSQSKEARALITFELLIFQNSKFIPPPKPKKFIFDQEAFTEYYLITIFGNIGDDPDRRAELGLPPL